MASFRSCFRSENVLCFSKKNWLNFGIFRPKISRYRTAPMTLSYQISTRRNMQSLAVTSSMNTHIPLLGPSVRRLLDSYGLDKQSIKPTGHKGQLLKGDVLKYINENSKTEIKFISEREIANNISMAHDLNLGYTDLNLSGSRQVFARQLVDSKNAIPHTYRTTDCGVDLLLSLCNQFNDTISINDFVIKAAALALRQVPYVNASWSDDGPVLFSGINIAVTMDSPNGQITPVLTNADQINVAGISRTIVDLKNKAMTGQLSPGELQNPSFTISNLLGVKSFTTVINPPQSAVLTVGDCEMTVGKDNKLSKIINVTLCCDGRMVDEQLASEWLTVFKDLIENPLQMGL
ncbi:dihydrolipoyllysine-residue acetyltransferase component of pyruvate dehydrogenase complex, mitochondrial-like [Dendronephthya gigantea]|uniref:dihydrolipoyllysine-residue acetyltransferase component of pyruvate dehydrogenase complex, mitochondrial-like n=1 Tax=Dendronephthya gigantea TaxID=151771 RepID=UPI00106D7902|nr:dihydrolipoyllysine-residue acetyltransferase component of pyruvate dehydrogenase complex, mitochondrial-like [Dendronephthya gigantea]